MSKRRRGYTIQYIFFKYRAHRNNNNNNNTPKLHIRRRVHRGRRRDNNIFIVVPRTMVLYIHYIDEHRRRRTVFFFPSSSFHYYSKRFYERKKPVRTHDTVQVPLLHRMNRKVYTKYKLYTLVQVEAKKTHKPSSRYLIEIIIYALYYIIIE